MRKQLLLGVILSIVFSGIALGQILYSDDFESYTIGEGIAQEETGDVWNTWSGTPGSSEDPLVTDAFAHGGTQSIVVEGSNDGVIEFDDITTNRYRVEFYLYIPAGKQGYYNIMQNFNPTGSGNVWGMQIFFQNGTGSIDGNGSAEQTFEYENDTWIKMQHFIDLDNDWVDMYIDGELVHAYQWSHGTFNDGTGLNKLDAFNFYAWNEGGTCQYYMDDFLIEQVAIPNPPTNFAIEVQNENDVFVTWDAPAEGTPVSYSVIRNGEEIGVIDAAATTEYLDEGLYPQEYEYQVKAYYGEGVGYSASAGIEIAEILGGNERQLVLFEIFTGTWCSHCPVAAEAIDMMIDEGLDIAVIEYHGGDDYETAFTSPRETYYVPFYDGDNSNTIGYPGTIINGMFGMEGALVSGVDDQNELYDYYLEEYLDIPTVFTLDANITLVSTDPYVFDIDVDVEETMPYYEDEMRLFIALTETNISENWGGLSEVNCVLREMLPNGNGELLDFSTETTYSNTFQLTVDGFNIENCEVVLFVQNMENAYTMIADKVSLAGFVGIESTESAQLSVYPNPAKDLVSVAASSEITNITVYTTTGSTVMQLSPNNNLAKISTKELNAGVYILKIETVNGNSMQRLTIE